MQIEIHMQHKSGLANLPNLEGFFAKNAILWKLLFQNY